MSRRVRIFSQFVSSVIVVFSLHLAGTAAAPQNSGPASYFVYIGTRADGIYGYRFSPASGQFDSLGMAMKLELPTWLAKSPDAPILYATNEVGNDGKSNGSLSSLRLDAHTGELELLNKVSAGGGGTTHLAIDKAGRFLLAANFGSGQVVAFRINKDGSIGQQTALVQHTAPVGSRSRSHAHEVVLDTDNRYVIVPDLGLDRVYTYKLDSETGALTPGATPFLECPAGAEPRHFAFHPGGRFAYLIEESGAAIVTFDYNKTAGSLKPIQTISILPDNFTGTKSGAEVWVEPKGRFLYAANRSDDTLLVFAIDAEHGTLTFVQRVSANGKSPRFIASDPTGKLLLAADVLSNQVVVFNIDPATGKLTASGQTLNVPMPTHFLFVPEE